MQKSTEARAGEVKEAKKVEQIQEAGDKEAEGEEEGEEQGETDQ